MIHENELYEFHPRGGVNANPWLPFCDSEFTLYNKMNKFNYFFYSILLWVERTHARPFAHLIEWPWRLAIYQLTADPNNINSQEGFSM